MIGASAQAIRTRLPAFDVRHFGRIDLFRRAFARLPTELHRPPPFLHSGRLRRLSTLIDYETQPLVSPLKSRRLTQPPFTQPIPRRREMGTLSDRVVSSVFAVWASPTLRCRKISKFGDAGDLPLTPGDLRREAFFDRTERLRHPLPCPLRLRHPLPCPLRRVYSQYSPPRHARDEIAKAQNPRSPNSVGVKQAFSAAAHSWPATQKLQVCPMPSRKVECAYTPPVVIR